MVVRAEVIESGKKLDLNYTCVSEDVNKQEHCCKENSMGPLRANLHVNWWLSRNVENVKR